MTSYELVTNDGPVFIVLKMEKARWHWVLTNKEGAALGESGPLFEDKSEALNHALRRFKSSMFSNLDLGKKVR